MITLEEVRQWAVRAEEAEAKAEGLRGFRAILELQFSEVNRQVREAEKEAKAIQLLSVTTLRKWEKKTDKWGEDQGAIGAMKDHPDEFTAEEIICEFYGDKGSLSEMTEGIAKVLVRAYPDSSHIEDLDAFDVVEHAHSVLN